MTDAAVTFLLGGARSGKSYRAQQLAEDLGGDLVYLATAQAFDDEMTERITPHRADRDARWRTVDCPLDLPASLRREAVAGRVVLIDCLTLWISNVMLSGSDCDGAGDALIAALGHVACPVIVVSNEVGMGIVPDNALARQFRDVAGRLNQKVAAVATRAMLVVAGLSLTLK